MIKTLSLEALRERVRSTHPRTRKAQLNTLIGLAVKGGGMVISLLLVPLTIDYLSKNIYGTWLTISSIVTMIAFFDIGIGNGLRNKLTEAVSKQDIVLARTYISTAYVIFGLLQLVFVLLFLAVFRYVPWQRILNTGIDTGQLQVIVLMMAVAIAIKLMLDVLSYVLFSLQESGLVSLISFLSNTLILCATYVLTRFSNGNLIYLGAVTAVSPIIVLLVSGFVLYRDRLKEYRPAFRLVDLKYAKNLLSLGYKFFFIQMTVIALFYTDNLIITQLFGPSEVTIYNVAFRYFNATSTLFSIAITPYWSAFTEASVKNDTVWMKRTYSYLKKLWLGLVMAVLLMVLIADSVYFMWIGNRVIVPHLLNNCMSLLVIVSCWNSITAAVVNGLGKIRLQSYYSLFAAVINVPLAILFGRIFHMGSAGVVLATTASLLIGSVFGTLQTKKLISGTAKGIWNS